MANPAIKFFVVPPKDASWPLVVTLSTDDPLVHFDLPSEVDAAGASKRLIFSDASPQAVYVATFPRRIKQSLTRQLRLSTSGGISCTVALKVTPVASDDKTAVFPITVDFSQDRTGFYSETGNQELFRLVVADWAFYIKDAGAQEVPASDELTFIFNPDGFKSGRIIKNSDAYRGFLLYGYGISSSELRSGGEPSTLRRAEAKTAHNAPWTPRSGGVETEVRGNYNTLGWLPASIADDAWWKATNLGSVQNDLYSILHHEIGHSLFFNPGHPRFVRDGVIKIRAASEKNRPMLVPTNKSDHFHGWLDPASLRGAFGNEYHGRMPLGRWLITRADLLVIRELGYTLRDVAPLLPLTLRAPVFPLASKNQTYSVSLSAVGGIPAYDWQVVSGQLPPGLVLDRFSGVLQGKPTEAGTFQFKIQVREYAESGEAAEAEGALTVAES